MSAGAIIIIAIAASGVLISTDDRYSCIYPKK